MRLQHEFDLICDALFEDELYLMQFSERDRKQGYKLLERIAKFGPRSAARAYRRTRKSLAATEVAHERAVRDFLR